MEQVRSMEMVERLRAATITSLRPRKVDVSAADGNAALPAAPVGDDSAPTIEREPT